MALFGFARSRSDFLRGETSNKDGKHKFSRSSLEMKIYGTDAVEITVIECRSKVSLSSDQVIMCTAENSALNLVHKFDAIAII